MVQEEWNGLREDTHKKWTVNRYVADYIFLLYWANLQN